jgi:hypothetical protein
MPLQKSIISSPSSGKREKNSPRSANKFIPNLTQLNEASKDLPTPDIWPEKTYKCPIEVDGKQRTIEFSLKSVNRGKKQAPRWIYQGKVLIRKRDI